MQCAAVAVPDEHMRAKVSRGLNSDELAEPNCFAALATAAAFSSEGGEWLDALNSYLAENRREAERFISSDIPQLKVVKGKASYLLWVDCSAVTDDAQKLAAHIRKTTGLWITAGNQYRGDGAHFLRINAACPRARLKDGLQRLKKGVQTFN